MRAQMRIAAGLLLALMATSASARTAVPVRPGPKGKNMKKLDANAWYIKTTNYGPFVFPEGSSSGGFWGGRGYNYIYGAGMYFGALDAGGTPHVAVGYNPNNGGSELGPCNPYTFDWANQAADPQAKVYLSTNAVDMKEWPVKDAKGANLVKSIQDAYAVYSDFDPANTFTGEVRVGVVVKQWSYAWNYADNNDIVFFYFRVFNKSGADLNSCYVGPCFDADIGNEAGSSANDRTGFWPDKNMAFQYQTEGEGGWPKVGYFGCRYFESPINNTGNVVTVTDVAPSPLPTFSHDIQPGDPLGLTAFKIFSIDIDPSTDADRYLEMRGISYKTMAMDAYDEGGATEPADKRFLMSSGPFNLAADDSVATCVGVMCATDSIKLKLAADVAQDIYDNRFELAVPPVAPELTVVPGDKFVRISWNRTSETTADPFYAKMADAADWYDYDKGTYNDPYTRIDTMRIDSFKLKARVSSATAKFPRGTVNPMIGTEQTGDTLQAHYNQKPFYQPYDFQGYVVYRAKTQSDLADPLKREPMGGLFTNTAGAMSYAYDKNDGVQVVRQRGFVVYATPAGTDTLPKYDTIGADRGLIYTFVDSNVSNNFGWWYGVSAYDYQPNVFFTKKCPVALYSSPAQNGVFATALPPVADITPSSALYQVISGSGHDANYNPLAATGTLNYTNKLLVSNTATVTDTKFYLRWQPTSPFQQSTAWRVPCYNGSVYDYVHTATEGFDAVGIAGTPAPLRWTFAGVDSTDTTAGNYGVGSPALKLQQTGDAVTTPRFMNPTALSYWIKGLGTDGASKLVVEGYNGAAWTVVDSVMPLPLAGTTFTNTLAAPLTQLRFVYTKSAGDLVLDDVGIRAEFLVDTLGLIAKYDSAYNIFTGTPYDEMTFGGVVFQPFFKMTPDTGKQSKNKIKLRPMIDTDSLQITEVAGGVRTYPRDSVYVKLDKGSNWKTNSCMWMWRGSDFEIHWRDTLVRIGAATVDSQALTCTVWDVTNNCEVPFQGGPGWTKATMTKAGWCFNVAGGANGPGNYLYHHTPDDVGMFISGVNIYFNKRNDGTTRRMDWANRPETGDVWRINCAGPITPLEGNVTEFTTTAPRQSTSLGGSILDNVRVVPNPYLVRAAWDVTLDYPNLYFTNLPAKCTIRIYNLSGDLVRVLDHSTNYRESNSSERWNLLTPYNKRVASGMYIYVVDAPGIGTKTGKFAVIK